MRGDAVRMQGKSEMTMGEMAMSKRVPPRYDHARASQDHAQAPHGSHEPSEDQTHPIYRVDTPLR